LNFTDSSGLVGFSIGPIKVGDGCALGKNPNGSCRGSGAVAVIGGAVETVGRCFGDPVTCGDNITKALSPVIVLGATIALAAMIVIGCVGSGGLLCAELIVFAGPGVVLGLYGTYLLADAVWFKEGHDKVYLPFGGYHDEKGSGCRS
jgi:hypothetical protein